MNFTKMHGIGNDYVFVNCFAEGVGEDPPEVARRVSDRHFGIGGDGLILIQRASTPDADCRMEMYNADGSRAEMCGNALRCVAKYVYDQGIRRKPQLCIETDDGLKEVLIHLGRDAKVDQVEVNMGPPRLARKDIPLVDGGDPSQPAVDLPVMVRGQQFHTTAVSMGNPHSVIRLDRPGADPIPGFEKVDEIPLAEWGPDFESHSWFPERVNTEFITCRSRQEIDFRVWERGSGETLACGTGACAAVVAAVVNDWCDREVLVHLRGGDLQIRWEQGSSDPYDGAVFMLGPAVEVFRGEWQV